MARWFTLCCLFIFCIKPVYAIELSISGSPETVEEDTPIPINFNLSQGTTASPIVYLRGVFYKEGTTQYFGYTENQLGNWVNSTADKSQFYELAVSPEGTASGTLMIKLDLQHSYFEGAGVYKIKLGRYTSSTDSSADWSLNELETAVTVRPTPTPSPSPASSPTPTPTPAPSPTPTPSPSPSPSPRATPSPSLDPSPNGGTVAGETTVDLTAFGLSPSPLSSPAVLGSQLTLNRDRALICLSIGLGLIIISTVGILGYRRYLSLQTHHI